MIQELLGGGADLIGERKVSIHGGFCEPSLSSSSFASPSASPSPSPTPSHSSSPTTATTAATNTASANQETQNLRCPRCDSSNTKFCYYNNYNLTQPRHFCKTCRRYWTKGGALRNVPIGGGCRKNKSSGAGSSTVACKSSSGKVKTLSSEMGKSVFDPILWGSPHNSHLLALLRPTQNPNPNPNTSAVKEEDFMTGTRMGSELNVLNQVSPLAFFRNNHQQHENSFMLGEAQNTTGIQDLYQRLRSSGNYYTDQRTPVVLGNVGSSNSSSSTILESVPSAGGEFGYWNPTYSWPDLSTANGAYP